MIICLKDVFKLIGISITACCAVFVCALFMNYNADLYAISDRVTDEVAAAMLDAQISMGRLTFTVTGCCLVATSAVMLLFYVKNYIDVHAKELGVLKATGYSDFEIARQFAVFAFSALLGCAAGYALASVYMPVFYALQNKEGLFPDFAPGFHFYIPVLLVIVPSAAFGCIAVFYACLKLKSPVCEMLKGKSKYDGKIRGKDHENMPFLRDLSKNVLREKKSLVFFTSFSAFCFSAMVQMSISMNEIAGETFAFMIITIGLILSVVTMVLSLTSVAKGNAKTIALMKVFGYKDSVVSNAVFGAYRPAAYVGFAVGTIYQYALLKIALSMFEGAWELPEYRFGYVALAVTFVAFVALYETVLGLQTLKIRRSSVKSVMSE